MLRNEWYAVLRAAEVKNKPLGVTRLGRQLVIWRGADGVQVAFDACPHRGAALSRGRVVDGELQCPYHGLRFSSDGACTVTLGCPGEHAGLHLAPMPVREAFGLVWVWFGEATPGALPWTEAMEAQLREAGSTTLDLTDTQGLVRLPGLSWLFTATLGWFDYKLLQRWQDAPVWRSQRLGDPADIHRYRLLSLDEGVRLYFELHHELTQREQEAA